MSDLAAINCGGCGDCNGFGAAHAIGYYPAPSLQQLWQRIKQQRWLRAVATTAAWWIILLLFFCGGCGNNGSFNNGGCGCGC